MFSSKKIKAVQLGEAQLFANRAFETGSVNGLRIDFIEISIGSEINNLQEIKPNFFGKYTFDYTIGNQTIAMLSLDSPI